MKSQEIMLAAADIKQLAAIEPKQASKRFELLASTLNDEQLIDVIEEMDIVTLTQINSEHDLSFPSIMTELMTPEHIRDIVCQQPLYWEEKIKANAEDLVQHTFDFLTYLIRSQESEAKQTAILECIAEDPAGLFYLSIPFIELYQQTADAETSEWDERHEDEEDLDAARVFTERRLDDDVHDLAFDDPKSLLTLIKFLAPSVETSIKNLLRNDDSGWEGIIEKFTAELVMQAKEKNKTEQQFAEVDDMFSFLE